MTIALDRSRDATPVPAYQYWAAYIYVEDAEALCAEFRQKGADIVRELEDTFYGSRNFDILDPDGHIIAFGHDLESDNTEPGLIDTDRQG